MVEKACDKSDKCCKLLLNRNFLLFNFILLIKISTNHFFDLVIFLIFICYLAAKKQFNICIRILIECTFVDFCHPFRSMWEKISHHHYLY